MTILATGVGSLPHDDPDAAAGFVLETADVPYLPQLPNRHNEEGMLLQWGDGLAGCGPDPGGLGLRCGTPIGPRHEAFIGAAALLDSFDRDPPIVKTQATGPVTLATALLAGGHDGAGLWDEVAEGLESRVRRHVAWLQNRLPESRVVLVYDEPALVGLGVPRFPVDPDRAATAIAAALDAVDIETGIHCCGDTDWGLVASLRPDFLSFDVAAIAGDFGGAAEAVAAAVAEGMKIMWGVVPASAPPLPDVEDLSARLRRYEGTLNMAGAPIDRLAGEIWVSPACGLAGLTVAQAEHVAATVRMVVGEAHADF